MATEIGPRTEVLATKDFIKKGVTVIPYPFISISKNQPVSIYFETYNLLFDDDGKTSYKMEYKLIASQTGLLRKIIPIGKRMTLSSSYDLSGSESNTQEYFALDFEKVKPGEYSLIVKVEDKIARESRTAEIEIKVVE